MSSVRVHLTTPPLGPDARRARFGYGDPCPGHEGLAGPATGAWAGRTLDEVAARDPQAIRLWLTDPEYAPPGGGESVTALIARTGTHLASLGPGTHHAVVGQAVVRAVVVAALELPPAAFWRLDVRPGTVTTLSGRAGRWNLLLGRTPDAEADPDPEADPDTEAAPDATPARTGDTDR
ncbi:histidine phosphatase family protein [Streptomyces sp. Isolate_45]|uniref:histidine phosphatase family protein n=1 Tax=Streptomyces sp. Isolate_45 TaxID=2950111 RepID=UPI002481BEBD|nr:histidine phosphatase family protein [Streptomyces sp. Isolate_45]MDA5283845.1 histidine phosphatase family protein [Streptomyces sp. Isolate_45]